MLGASCVGVVSLFGVAAILRADDQLQVKLIEDALPDAWNVACAGSHEVVQVLPGDSDLLGELRLGVVAPGECNADGFSDACIHDFHVDTVSEVTTTVNRMVDQVHTGVYSMGVGAPLALRRTTQGGAT
jgi:hypothetical protein